MISKVRDKVDQVLIRIWAQHHRCEICQGQATWQCDQCFGWRCDDHWHEVYDEYDRWSRICTGPTCLPVFRA